MHFISLPSFSSSIYCIFKWFRHRGRRWDICKIDFVRRFVRPSYDIHRNVSSILVDLFILAYSGIRSYQMVRIFVERYGKIWRGGYCHEPSILSSALQFIRAKAQRSYFVTEMIDSAFTATSVLYIRRISRNTHYMPFRHAVVFGLKTHYHCKWRILISSNLHIPHFATFMYVRGHSGYARRTYNRWY